jgi:hypothetical protein
MKNFIKVLALMMSAEGACLTLKPKEYLKFWRMDSVSGLEKYQALIDKLLAVDERIWRVWGVAETALGAWLYLKNKE